MKRKRKLHTPKQACEAFKLREKKKASNTIQFLEHTLLTIKNIREKEQGLYNFLFSKALNRSKPTKDI